MAQDFTLDHFRRQLDQLQKMGVQNPLGGLPGTPAMVSDPEAPDVALNRMRQIIDAMTDEERRNPDRIDSSRRSRIATTSGAQPKDVEKLLAQFDQVRALMRQMAGMTVWERMKMIRGFGKLPEQEGGA